MALTTGNGWQSSRSSCSSTFFRTPPGNCTISQNLRGRRASAGCGGPGFSIHAHCRLRHPDHPPSCPDCQCWELVSFGRHSPVGHALPADQGTGALDGQRLIRDRSPPTPGHTSVRGLSEVAPPSRPALSAATWDSHSHAGPQLLDVLGLPDLLLTEREQLHTEGVAARQARGAGVSFWGQLVPAA